MEFDNFDYIRIACTCGGGGGGSNNDCEVFMRELFDKQFVRFMWDDELEGKVGFFFLDGSPCGVKE